MSDVFSEGKRSEIMSRIRSKETTAERIVFQYLNLNKVYYQKHYRRALGTPDIALPRKKRAIFIDSEFWHGKNFVSWAGKRNEDDFWVKKITANMERDSRQRSELVSLGWHILVVWEKDIKRKRTQMATLDEIKQFLLKA